MGSQIIESIIHTYIYIQQYVTDLGRLGVSWLLPVVRSLGVSFVTSWPAYILPCAASLTNLCPFVQNIRVTRMRANLDLFLDIWQPRNSSHPRSVTYYCII